MMAPQAATVDLLVKKARFEPQVAIAVAEAIDSAMNNSQFVTVPILDARLSDLRADVRADLQRLDHKIDTRCAELDKKMEVGFAALEKKMEVGFAARDKKMEVGFAAQDKKMEVGFATLERNIGVAVAATKAELVRWVFIAMGSNLALSGGVVAILNALQHH